MNNTPLTIGAQLKPHELEYKTPKGKWRKWKSRKTLPALTLIRYGSHRNKCFNCWTFPIRIVTEYNGQSAFYFVAKQRNPQ